MPLWAQVLEDLRARLADGELTERFPTDRELVDDYGVSRQTVRDAVRRLREEGFVTRERGRGSFVQPRTIEQSLGALYSLFRSIEDQGFEQTSVVRTLERRVNAEAAERLELPAGAPLVFLERVRLADDEPVAVDCSWLPAEVAGGLVEAADALSHGALYEVLAERCGLVLTGGWERIRPELPTPEQADLLAVPTDRPLFAIERLAFRGEAPVEWRHAVVRGDRYAFTARWGSVGDQETGLSPT